MAHWGACQSSAAISEHYTKTSTVQQLSNLPVVIRKHPVNSFGEVGFALNNLWHPDSLVSSCWSPDHPFWQLQKMQIWLHYKAPIRWFVHHDQTYHNKLIIQRSLYYVHYIIYTHYIIYIRNISHLQYTISHVLYMWYSVLYMWYITYVYGIPSFM